MPINTRLDGRSKNNNEIAIKGEDGVVVALITTISPKVELSVVTKPGYHIEKPNGFSSKKK